MNPGLVVKLRPTGPWRIGPDSGARNRVDNIYHSDTLYAAVTGALARLGPLEEWLSATARKGVPAVCFSSCFPFLDEIGFIIPPRTVWPPTSPALLSARLRWKSARFVPLGMVPEILAGRALDENQWSVDAASECLVPAGRPGPFRAGMRTNAAVDRLSGAAERHSTACIEFRSGAGLWTVVSFADAAAAAQWMDPVKTAFRLLADSGFGGERSRGWGRSEAPEFIEGVLPEMILPAIAAAGASMEGPPVEEPPTEPPSVEEPPAEPTPVEDPPTQPPVEEPPSEEEPSPEEPPAHEASVLAPMAILPLSVESAEAELGRISEPAPAAGLAEDSAPVSTPESKEETSVLAEQPAVSEPLAAVPTGGGIEPVTAHESNEEGSAAPESSAETAAESSGPQPSAASGAAAVVIVSEPSAVGATGESVEPVTGHESNEEGSAVADPPASAEAAAAPSTLEPPVTSAAVKSREAIAAPEPGDETLAAESASSEGAATAPAPESTTQTVAESSAPQPVAALEGNTESAHETAIAPPGPDPQPPPPDPEPEPAPAPPVPEPEPAPPSPAPLPEPEPAPPTLVPPVPAPEPEPFPEPGPAFPEPLPAAPQPTAAGVTHPHWLLSLFTPGPADAVDWARGSYSLVARGGRIDSPVRSGERKKQLPMIVEGSVLYVAAPPAGSAPDVAPDGFVHPVYRAGFALSIPLPEVR